MKWSKFNKVLGRLASQSEDMDKDLSQFTVVIDEMVELLDEADLEDFFGTEGWKHRLGLKD